MIGNKRNDKSDTNGYHALSAPGPVDIVENVVLAGPFDPATLARLMDGDAARELSTLTGPLASPIHRLASGLKTRGVNTIVLGSIEQLPEMDVRSSNLRAILYHKRGTAAFILDGWRHEREAILKRLQEIRPSIVHAHWTLEAARAVADWDGPKVLTIHDAAYECVRLGWKWNPLSAVYFARWLANTSAVLRRFQHVIAVSPFVETYLRLRHGFRGDIQVIPNAIPPLPATVRPADTFPKTLSLTFGCYGMPGRLKNVDSAIEAFHRVKPHLPNSRLLVFGAGWEELSPRYAGSRIEFRGGLPHQDFLRCLACEVDIWVHPSRIEAHPIAPCEALQAGCPVIAGRASGGVAWTLDYGRAGVLVDVENPEEIAAAMLSLAHDRERATSLVSYGRRMILERFSPDLVLEMHLQYYRQVVEMWDRGANLAVSRSKSSLTTRLGHRSCF